MYCVQSTYIKTYFTFSLSCLTFRKFVPANLTSLELEIEKKCQKMYINVLSTSIDEKDAFICCNELNSHDDLKWWDVLHVFTSYEYGICSPKVSRKNTLLFISFLLMLFTNSYFIYNTVYE